MGGEGRVGVPVERGKKYRMRGADAPLGGAHMQCISSSVRRRGLTLPV